MGVKPGEIQLELLKLLPGTYFRDNADLYNIKYSPLPPYEVLETNNISYYELNKAVVLSKILDRWYNNSIWRDILVLYINNSLEKLADLVESLSKTDFAYKSYSQEYLSLLLFNFIKNEESTSFEFKKIWIENGMSLKKEPATSLLSWKPGNSLYNPLFIEGNSKNKYYYLQFNNKIKWYLFNSEIERTKPIKEIEITCY